MKRREETYTVITPPADLYRVEVHTDWRYGKRAKFWEIQQFNQELSNRYGEVYYTRACKGGLVYTNLGLWFAVRRKMRKLKNGYSTSYYALDKSLIEKKES